LSSSFVAVQCTLFDKNPERNWLVAFHQDLSIPVKNRVAHASLGVWSEKEGEHFVQAPLKVLETLLAVRIHIDDCGVENGPLRVVPGSHLCGRIADSTALDLRDTLGEEQCLAEGGDAVIMRPLILHASSKAAAPSRRRVLHILFGPESLPYGLEWKYGV
jgi:ectoine hydroxylase-related dioxygenase (phytanoyl-CoA dioxygenase family)